MILWRVCSEKYASFFNGEGGQFAPGRWHSMGQPVTYASSALSLALLERLAHVEDPALLPPSAIVAYETPGEIAIEDVELSSLPPEWRDDVVLTHGLGDEWIRTKRSPLLRVPSVILPLPDIPDRNIVINHAHADVRRIKILRTHQPFGFDARLLRRA